MASIGPPPPSNLNGGFNWSLCCEEEEDLQGAEWTRNGTGEGMAKAAGG